MAKTLLKIILWIVGIIVGLFLLVWIAIQIPSVQNAVADKLTQSLSRTLKTEVSIDRVNIRFIKTILLEGIYIESLQNDTLLYAKRIGVNIGLFDLFDNRIHVNDVSLEGAVVRLERTEMDSLFNYQFILDAFNTNPDTTAAETVWTFDIDDVNVEDSYFRMLDRYNGTDIELNIKNFAVNMGELDLEKQIVDINTIRLEDSKIAYRILKTNRVKPAPEPPTSDTALIAQLDTMAFPTIGWSLSLSKMRLNNNTIIYDNQTVKTIPNAVDFNHITLNELEINLNNLAWREKVIQGEIETIAFKERSGFELQKLGADLQMNERQVSVKDFVFQTPQSDFRASTTLSYNSFSDLMRDITNNARVDLTISDSKLAFKDLEYFAPSITEIKQLNTNLNKEIRLSARAQGTLSNLSSFSANLGIENGVQLRANGSASNLTNPDLLSYNVTVEDLSTSYNNLKRLTRGVAIPAGLKTLGQVRFSGRFQGDMNKVNGNDIILQTDAYTGFRGDIKAQQIRNVDQLTYQVNIRELRTQAKDLNGFVAGGLPVQVKNLGKIRYVGTLAGTTTKFDLDGDLITDAGSVNSDVVIDFNKNYSNATYNGKVNLRNFNLGKVLQDTTIGRVTMTMSAVGGGLSLNTINAKLKGNVAALDYKGYRYKDFRIDGTFDKKQFTGKAGITDPNIAFGFNGNINFNDKFPAFRFVADVDTVNLQKLNFSPTFLGFSGEITANFRGVNIDDLDGTARIRDINISNDSISYQTDSIVLTAATPDTTGKLLTLESSFLDMQLSGNYNIADLPKLMQNFINDYFPVDQFLSPVDTPTKLALEPDQSRVLTDQNFDLLIQLSNPISLLKIFVPTLERLDTASFSMHLDTKARDLKILGSVPQLIFGGRSYDNIRLAAEGTPEELITSVTVENVNYGALQPISLAEVNIALGNDSITISLNAEEGNGDSTRTKLALAGNASRLNDMYRFAFDPRFVLNGETWDIPSANEFLYKPNFIDINNFALQKDGQSIAISSADSPSDKDFAPIGITFDKFQIKEIFNLMNMSEDKYSGEVNGTVTLRDFQTNLNYLVDLSINNIALNDQPVGNLFVKAEPVSKQVIRVNVALDGEQSDATIAGTYNLSNTGLDLKADIQALELKLLDPFASAFIKDSEGTLSGSFTIQGTTKAPEMNGVLRMNQISTVPALLGVRYTIPQAEIRISDKIINLGTIALLDGSNNEATLSGTVNYANFVNIGLNLNFNTNRFKVLDTQTQGNSLYYGKLLIDADVAIRGTTTAPVVTVNATTLDSSQLFIQPLSAQQAIGAQEDYIIFGNPATFRPEDTTLSLDAAYQVNRAAIDLTLNLQVTPETELQIIIDPATGDKLVCKGSADLVVNMNPNGKLSITGNYQITEGSYSLNYQGLLKRNFAIRSGSRLDFVGDPLDTRFNVAAIYTTKTPTYELIRNQVTALSPEQERQAKSRSDVNVVLSMRGDLEKPIITFDIQIGEEGESDPVTSVEAQALARLRDNPSELNTQVFSLLLFNSFISEQSGGGGLAGAGNAAYLSSVSSLVSNQLNKLADRLVKGVDIEIGVDSYQSEYESTTTTELNLGVSKQLFNDRLTVQVGGNVNVNSENSLLVQGAGFSSIAGDFVLEYRLTEEGNYRLRVFRRESVDVLNQNSNPQTGVGISYKKSFGQKGLNDKSTTKKKSKKQDKKPVEGSNNDALLPDNELKMEKE